MTRDEWLASEDPVAMLAHVRGKLSARRLRLYACALARQVWDGRECGTCIVTGIPGMMCDGAGGSRRPCPTCGGTGRVGGLTDERSRRAVEVAELYADGLATENERRTAYEAAGMVERQIGTFEAELAWKCSGPIEVLTANNGLPKWFSVSTTRAAAQASLLRCVAGNPWRPVARLWQAGRHNPEGPSGRHYETTGEYLGPYERMRPCLWLTPTVIAIARDIYERRAWDEVGVLADALEEAGCGDEPCPNCKDADFASSDFGGPLMGGKEPYASRTKAYLNAQCSCKGTRRAPNPLLQHLRSAGPHCRGCHCIDLLLGKE